MGTVLMQDMQKKAIIVSTEKLFYRVIAKMKREGQKFNWNTKYVLQNIFNNNSHIVFCICINDSPFSGSQHTVSYGSISAYMEKGIKIIKAEEYLKESNKNKRKVRKFYF